MELSLAVSDDATEETCERDHELCDQIAEQVGVLAERLGFTMDEVVAPLWATEATPQG
jgi:hypothetical protein